MNIRSTLHLSNCNLGKSNVPKLQFEARHDRNRPSPELLDSTIVKSAERAVERNGGELNFYDPLFGQVQASFYDGIAGKSLRVNCEPKKPEQPGEHGYGIALTPPTEIVSKMFTASIDEMPNLKQQRDQAHYLLREISEIGNKKDSIVTL